jgi:hypothetical protein
MIHRSLVPSLLCAVFCVLGAPRRAQACLTTTCAAENAPPSCVRDVGGTNCWLAGEPLQWAEPCVAFSVDARGIPGLGLNYADTEELVATAFAAWPSVDCSAGSPAIAVRSAGPVACNAVEYNSEGPNANAVIFQAKRWAHDFDAIGVTTVSFNAETGRIVDADIEVNMTVRWLDYLAVQYVLTHEAGHFFGIDHSSDPRAVMYAQSSASNFLSPPELSDDDRSAICLAYPTDRDAGACDFEPEKGYSPVCGGDLEASCSVGRHPAPGNDERRHVLVPLIALVTLLAARRRGFPRRAEARLANAQRARLAASAERTAASIPEP